MPVSVGALSTNILCMPYFVASGLPLQDIQEGGTPTPHTLQAESTSSSSLTLEMAPAHLNPVDSDADTGAAVAQGAGAFQEIPVPRSSSPEEIFSDAPLQRCPPLEQALRRIYLRSALVPCDFLQINLDSPSRAFHSSSAGSVLFSRCLSCN